MPVQIVLRKEQLQDLSVLSELGTEAIQSLTRKLASLDPAPIRTSEIQHAINDSLAGRENEAAVVMRLIMHFYTLRRQRGLSEKELLEGISHGIAKSKQWTEDAVKRWKALEVHLAELFSLSTVWAVVKALDLSYEYANLLQSAKIITDIRPVFSEDASGIHGAVVTHTLRLYYDSMEGSSSISIAVDDRDIKKLISACNRALVKANTAKSYMQAHDVKRSIICGEEE